MKSKFMILLFSMVLAQSTAWSCTIFCAIDSHGHVWSGNNEDYYFSMGTKTNVVSRTDSTFGFIWYNYENNRYAQGGINEAGLFYDLNSVEDSEIKDLDKKIIFPGENIEDFYLYLLGHCKTVPEVFELYSKYYMPWMKGGQMNVADKQGNMGIVTADSAWLVTSNFSISTNYNLCHNDNDYKTCWRYPIAEDILKKTEPSLETFAKICEATSQKKIITTIFSSISNLNTGDIWFYYAWDYKNAYKTSIQELVEMGDTVLIMRDWFPERPIVKAYYSYIENDFTTALGVLNEIDDPQRREDMLKLLAIDMLAGSSRDKATNALVTKIIETSNHEDLVGWLSAKATTKENRNRALRKKVSIQMANILNSVFFWLALFGGIIILSILLYKRRNKRQLSKSKIN